MKTLTINNVYFELHTSRMHNVAPITGCRRDEIFEVYGRPSVYKVAIWHDWCDWCEQLNNLGYECGIQIESYNCNFFTISGSLRMDGKVYDLWITRSHNRIYQHQNI